MVGGSERVLFERKSIRLPPTSAWTMPGGKQRWPALVAYKSYHSELHAIGYTVFGCIAERTYSYKSFLPVYLSFFSPEFEFVDSRVK